MGLCGNGTVLGPFIIDGNVRMAPSPRTVDVSEFLTEFFRRKIIAIEHPIEWPPRSPDLTPCVFFSMGISKKQSVLSSPCYNRTAYRTDKT